MFRELRLQVEVRWWPSRRQWVWGMKRFGSHRPRLFPEAPEPRQRLYLQAGPLEVGVERCL